MILALKQPAEGQTLSAVIGEFRDWLDDTGSSPKTIANAIGVVSAWLDAADLGDSGPAAVTERHVSAYVNDTSREAKASTRRLDLGIIRKFLGFINSRGWAPTNPASLVRVKLDRLSHEQKENRVRVPFTASELQVILTALEARKEQFWLFAVRASLEWGLRLGDICALEWACFAQDGFLVVWTGKRDKRVQMPVSDEMRAIVEAIPKENKRFLFPDRVRQHQDPRRRAGLSMWFGRFLESIGIRGKSFHCLRHTKATNDFARSGKDDLARKLAEALTMDQIAALLGHSNTKTTKGYIHAK